MTVTVEVEPEEVAEAPRAADLGELTVAEYAATIRAWKDLWSNYTIRIHPRAIL